MIKLGPAGSHGLGNEEGIKHCKELNLKAMEVEFTYGVRMNNSTAKKVGAIAKKLGIQLSVHGPYYINLNSADKVKISASKKRILDSCERAANFGTSYKVPVVFHAAFYGKNPDECYANVKKAIIEMNAKIKERKWNVILAPETTGKKSQFGTIEELLQLSKETGCSFCIDFAHLLAREGKRNYKEIFERLKGVKKMHIHFSGIEYSDKGERRHKLTSSSELKELITELKKRKISAVIINESPDGYGDSVKGLKYL
jgi:deoxyribonuclease-4